MSDIEACGRDRARRSMLVGVALMATALLGCSSEQPVPSNTESTETKSAEQEILACIAGHRATPAFRPIVAAMCSERFRLRGVSVAVAIARGDDVVFELAMGPRCEGEPDALRPDTTLRMGSVTKLVTAAVASSIANQRGISLREPLDLGPPTPTAPLSLHALLSHTSGLRDSDPPPVQADEWWPKALGDRVAPGSHHYANVNYLAVGRWLEHTTGQSFAELYAELPTLAPLRERVSFDRDAAKELGCSHYGWGTWQPVPLRTEALLPAFTLPSGGGLASTRDLARLPDALRRMGVLETMIADPTPTERPGIRYGLGVRISDNDDGPVLAHSGQTAGQWAELQWSPAGGYAVAVMSSTPRAYKATLLAAFEAARSAKAEQRAPLEDQ